MFAASRQVHFLVREGQGRALAAAPRFDLVDSSPYVAIRNQISEFHPDLLAMGTHARSALKAAMTGSLAREFLVEAACDVLVARA